MAANTAIIMPGKVIPGGGVGCGGLGVANSGKVLINNAIKTLIILGRCFI